MGSTGSIWLRENESVTPLVTSLAVEDLELITFAASCPWTCVIETWIQGKLCF